MTLTGDFGAPLQEEQGPTYPTFFGITLTPIVSGILIAIVGLGAAAYLATILIAPKLEEAAQIQLELSQKEDDLARREEILRQLNEVIASIGRARAENQQVRGLFASQEALDTLLLDLNGIIMRSSAQLNSFEPDYAASGIVQDGSLGPELNGKLRRQVTSIAMEGAYAQTLQVMEQIDQQQNVLVIRDLILEQIPEQAGQVRSTFKLVAYVPLTTEEIAAAAPAEEAAQGESDAQGAPEEEQQQ
ncbi:pilus assembly protein PilO [Candidatus Synechococcus calcipolaris G9]|uniref:Pilus assembly protein PilO n=1 Tax=Candidatus Synechococcus calcipolaris G9 TaxID=1497997 RepID=A0ABT6EWG6_9SYNE|nr:pilus assembly protein PilO [Candidatus Synechococcus calcipolaris]MDG2990113.1 pilus assembly protein PilO [Candidatus Synechococcus calcipolaris G9]